MSRSNERTIRPQLLVGAAHEIDPEPSEERLRSAGRVRFSLMLITDGVGEPAGEAGAPPLDERIAQALASAPPGSVALQLRNRRASGRELTALALRLRELTARCGAELFINDRLDVARAVGADGVHLPSSGLPVNAARRAAGEVLRISAAAHSIPEARMAALGGADLVTFGPVWPTPSKPEGAGLAKGQQPVRPCGVGLLAAAVRSLPVPVFALGGIDGPGRAAECAAVGARVACLRGVLGAADPGRAVRVFLDAVAAHARC